MCQTLDPHGSHSLTKEKKVHRIILNMMNYKNKELKIEKN